MTSVYYEEEWRKYDYAIRFFSYFAFIFVSTKKKTSKIVTRNIV